MIKLAAVSGYGRLSDRCVDAYIHGSSVSVYLRVEYKSALRTVHCSCFARVVSSCPYLCKWVDWWLLLGKQCFVNFQQRLFIVNKQVKQVLLIFQSKVFEFYLVLSQLHQAHQRLFKLLRFYRSFSGRLLSHDLWSQSPLHYVFSYLFYAVYKHNLQLAAFSIQASLFTIELPW